jgi:hypothetical protein
LVTNQLWATVPGGRDAFDDTETRLVRTDSPDATGNEAATAWLRVTVWDDEEKQAGRSFSGAATQLALSSIPGFYASTPTRFRIGFRGVLARADPRVAGEPAGHTGRPHLGGADARRDLTGGRRRWRRTGLSVSARFGRRAGHDTTRIGRGCGWERPIAPHCTARPGVADRCTIRRQGGLGQCRSVRPE